MPSVLLTESIQVELGGQEPWPQDVKLYQPYEVEQILLPDNANCLAVQAYLKMCGLNFEVEPRSNAEYMSPSGRVPFIKCGAFVVSELDPIIAFVGSKGVSLTNSMDSSQKADMRAYMSLVNTVLANAELYVCWCDSTTMNEVTKPRYGSVFPWPLNHVLSWQKRNQVTKRLGILGWTQKSLQEVYQEVESCCNALSERLEGKEYFFGESPTDLDALVYGHLYAILTIHPPLRNIKLASVICKFRSLLDLVNRVDQTFFQRSSLMLRESIILSHLAEPLPSEEEEEAEIHPDQEAEEPVTEDEGGTQQDEGATQQDEAPAAEDDATAQQDEEPVAVYEAPATEDDGTAQQDEEPVTVDEVPATEDDGTAQQDEEPVTVDEAPATEDDGTAQQDEEPVTVDEAPATEDDRTAQQDEEPVTVDEAPEESDQGGGEATEDEGGETAHNEDGEQANEDEGGEQPINEGGEQAIEDEGEEQPINEGGEQAIENEGEEQPINEGGEQAIEVEGGEQPVDEGEEQAIEVEGGEQPVNEGGEQAIEAEGGEQPISEDGEQAVIEVGEQAIQDEGGVDIHNESGEAVQDEGGDGSVNEDEI